MESLDGGFKVAEIRKTVVALDAMGGDYAPLETVKGAVEAVDSDESIIVRLFGFENEIKGGGGMSVTSSQLAAYLRLPADSAEELDLYLRAAVAELENAGVAAAVAMWEMVRSWQS